MSNLPLLTGLALLRARKATQVVVVYSGSGDSGQTDSVRSVTARGKDVPIPEELHDLIDTWTWEKVIPDTGWWNGDGGFGTVTIDLKTYEAVCEHSDRTGETNSSGPKLSIPIRDPIRKVLAVFRDAGAKEVSVSYDTTEAHWSFTTPPGMTLPKAEQELKEWVWEHVVGFPWPTPDEIDGRTADVFGTVTFEFRRSISVKVEHSVTHYGTTPDTRMATVE